MTKPTPNKIYFDYNGFTPPRKEVLEALTSLLPLPLNPSSSHYLGQKAKTILEEARDKIQQLTHCKHVIFTSSASEANNLALHSLLHQLSNHNTKPIHIISYLSEHPSILNFLEQYTKKNSTSKLILLPLDQHGQIDLNQLDRELKKSSQQTSNILTVAQIVNHETGIIQPIKNIADLCHQHGACLMSDACQSIGHLPFNLTQTGAIAATIAGQKLGGIAGAAAILFTTLPPAQPFIYGGGQEQGFRAGTENIIAIHAMALALEICLKKMPQEQTRFKIWQRRLLTIIQKHRPTITLAGYKNIKTRTTKFLSNEKNLIPPYILPHVLMFIDANLKGQEQVLALDLFGILASSGSACASGIISPSPTLLAMGYTKAQASNGLRLSFGHATKESDIGHFEQAYNKMLTQWQ